MASLERRYDGRYRIIFCYQGTRFTHSLGKVPAKEARSCQDRLEENLRFLERGLLDLPADADLGVFLVSGGKLNARPVLDKPLSLAQLFARYQEEHPDGVKETNTRYTEDIHIKHLLRILGGSVNIRAITTATLQSYAAQRSLEKSGRGKRPISHATVKKEIGTFASVWNKWALPLGIVAGPAPTKGLIYRKQKAKPPFQTWEQIERQIGRGGLSAAEQKELWDSLFLRMTETRDLLEHVRIHARRKYVYVMFCFAAFTGARRSEMLRSRADDFDFTSNKVTIREKKKDRSKELTFRSVPMTPAFRKIMEDWFREHPGGQFAICSISGQPISVQMAAKGFRNAVKESKWDVLLGWHVLRHSFASNCALQKIDARVIDGWLGHQTEEMRLRYQHLFPDQQHEAISSVFW